MKISQREAHRLKARVKELESMYLDIERLKITCALKFALPLPDARHVDWLFVGTESPVHNKIELARRLKYSVVVTAEPSGYLHFRAVPIPLPPATIKV